VGQHQHLLEGEEVIVFLKQSKASVGPIEDMIDQPAGGVSSDSRHDDSLCASVFHVKVRVTFNSAGLTVEQFMQLLGR
jgi:hypothetical protein